MILADTSAWVEFDRATSSRVDQRITQLISDDGPLVVTQPVIMEIVAAARSDGRKSELRQLLGRFTLLDFDAVVDFDAASTIYRRCRRVGVNPRGMVDCMIASVALRYGAQLLAADSDLVRVATVVGVDLDSASVGA